MSKKKPSLPSTPEFQAEPGLQPNIDRLSDLGGRLTSFDFGGELSPLQETIDLDPEVTRLALEFAENSLNPAFKRTRQNTINELAQRGALTSSTLSDAFAEQDLDLNSQLRSITAGAALSDRERALQNRLGIFGTGLQTTQAAAGLGLSQQDQLNRFAQTDFSNQLALRELGRDTSGGIAGGLTGALGGAATGFAFGGPLGAFAGGLAGGAAGAFGPSGTGGEILKAGTTLAARPRSTAGAGRRLAKRGQTVQTGSGPISLLRDLRANSN